VRSSSGASAANRVDSDDAEMKAQRVVAISFFLLAPYIIVSATHHLVVGSKAEASWVGIGLAVVSVTLFGRAKKRIGNRLQSHATAGEGTQNILCAYLSRDPRRPRGQRRTRALVGRPARRPVWFMSGRTDCSLGNGGAIVDHCRLPRRKVRTARLKASGASMLQT
jgi:hypothetical protein